MKRKRPVLRALLCFIVLAAVAGASCRPSPAPVTIRAGLLLDGTGGQQQDAVITVVGDRIRDVAPYHGGAVTHDFSRYTVLPGLIDAHVHITGYINRLGRVHTGGDGETPAQVAAGREANALATLRAGFTTVASMGSGADDVLRDSIDAGVVPGPRILTSLTPFADTSLSPRRLRQQVWRRKAGGADFIKVFGANAIGKGGMPTFSGEQLSAICGEARVAGLRSVVHVQSDASLAAAVAAGCDRVEHGFFATAEGLRVLANRGAAFDPQCGLVLRNYLENKDRLEGVQGFDSATFALLEELKPALPAVIRTALATPGLRILYGSDATGGAHGWNADDLVCRVRQAGEPHMDALVSATSRNAAALGLGTEIGTIAPGFRADLIALDGNPLIGIEAVRRVKFVMKDGKVFLSP